MNLFSRLKGRASALLFAMVAMFAAVPAFAQETDISTGVVTAITGANPQITAVVTAMASAIVLIVVWRLIKGAMGK